MILSWRARPPASPSGKSRHGSGGRLLPSSDGTEICLRRKGSKNSGARHRTGEAERFGIDTN